MNLKTFLLLAFLFLYGCAKNKTASTNQTKNYNAIVGSMGMDCGSAYLLSVFKDDETKTPVIVYEINLPDSRKTNGLKVLIESRTPTANEMMRCTTLGPGYNQIYILTAQKVIND